MKHFLFLISSLLCLGLKAQDIRIGEWRVHIPYSNAIALAASSEFIYCGTELALFSHNTSDRTTQIYNKVNGLADISVSTLSYDPSTDVLLVAYDNANIDLLKNGLFTNISDIARKNLVGNKRINHVYFYNGLAYLSCGFGIVVLDPIAEEIKDTYFIGPNGNDLVVNQITVNGGKIYAATDIGVMEASITNPFLADAANWTLHDTLQNVSPGVCKQITVLNAKVYCNIKDSIFVLNAGVWSYLYTAALRTINSMTTSQGQLYLTQHLDTSGVEDAKVIVLDPSGTNIQIQNTVRFGHPEAAFADTKGTVWIADSWFGLIRYDGFNYETINPNAPGSSSVQEISIHDGRVWVAAGNVSTVTWTPLFSPDGFFSLVDNWWTNFGNYNLSALDSIKDIMTVVTDPTNQHVYLGSYGGGLVEYYNGSIIKVYKQSNSSLQGTVGDLLAYRVSGLAFDENNNLWMSNFGAPKPISVKKFDGNWRSFSPPSTLDLGGNFIGAMVVDDFNQKWFVLPQSKGILVYDSGADIDAAGDDQYVLMVTGEGKGSLPNINVLCIAKDLDGEIWIGTKEGIAVFYCASDVFINGCEAERILVKEGDFFGFLMETESVNTIAVDAADRKWIGTDNGVWLMSPDGTEVVFRFTKDNSPLPSNGIIDIAVDHNSGEVYIGTDKGIISYKSTATEGGLKHTNVYVYPNPVRPGYNGTIAVKGLVRDAFVKITDINGGLIYETRALGGQAIWDGKNYNGVRAKTGVYLVFSTNAEGSETYVAKFLLLN